MFVTVIARLAVTGERAARFVHACAHHARRVGGTHVQVHFTTAALERKLLENYINIYNTTPQSIPNSGQTVSIASKCIAFAAKFLGGNLRFKYFIKSKILKIDTSNPGLHIHWYSPVLLSATQVASFWHSLFDP